MTNLSAKATDATLSATFEKAGYKRPARFHIWQGEVLVAVSNCEMNDAELREFGHLFAAAPDLLEACRAALGLVRDVHMSADTESDFARWAWLTRTRLEDAIAKAEGRNE